MTDADPAVAMSLAGTWAVRYCTKPPPLRVGVVVKLTPFQRTTELCAKVLPLTVILNAAPPDDALDGDREVIDGDGAWTLKL